MRFNHGYERLRAAAQEHIKDIRGGARETIERVLCVIYDETYNRYLWAVWHRTCDELAFFMTEDPRKTTIKSSNSVNPDNGQHFEYGAAILCYSCGRPMRARDILVLPPERTKKIYIPGGNVH